MANYRGSTIVAALSSGYVVCGVEAHLPDLVLADVEMPEMDGIDIAKIMAGQWPNIGVILISSNNEPFYYQAAKESRALAFIAKTNLSLVASKKLIVRPVAVALGNSPKRRLLAPAIWSGAAGSVPHSGRRRSHHTPGLWSASDI